MWMNFWAFDAFHGAAVGAAGSVITAFYFEALLVKSLQGL